MRRILQDSLRIRHTQLSKEISVLEKRLKTAPKGTLRIGGSHGCIQYFIFGEDDVSTGRYLKVSEIGTAKALAQKDHDGKELKRARKEKKLVDDLISFLRCNERVFDGLSTQRKAIVTPYVLSDEEYAVQWMSEQYEHKGFSEGAQQYRTERGELVRSKSEALIANMLNSAGIPYKYERPLRLNTGDVIRPDFTILNKRTREVYYLEHFGMLDDEKYRDSFFRRMRLYSENGFAVGDTLFVSFEGNTIGHGFDAESIQNLIKNCFS